MTVSAVHFVRLLLTASATMPMAAAFSIRSSVESSSTRLFSGPYLASLGDGSPPPPGPSPGPPPGPGGPPPQRGGVSNEQRDNSNYMGPLTSNVGGAAVANANPPPPVLAGPVQIQDIWNALQPEIVQGQSLRTWSFESPAVDRVQVLLKTEGRPLNAKVDLWQGPDNTPQKMDVYVEDGSLRTFSAVIATPRGGTNTIAVRNSGVLEFPLHACVQADDGSVGLEAMIAPLAGQGRIVQGGAVFTIPFAPQVQSVRCLLTTDGRPLRARIELLQGPNNNKQVVELYTEDGYERPFFMIIETPGTGNVVRICNTATVEFPLAAAVEADIIVDA